MPALPWRLKKWNGSAWVDADQKRWDGASWALGNTYFWDGGAWVLCTDRTPPTSTYNEQYDRVPGGAGTYDQSGNATGLGNNYQGYYDGVYGIHRSMWLWDYSVIAAALAPRVATYGVQLYMENIHTYFGSGGYAIVGTHNNVAIPSTFVNLTRYNFQAIFFAKGASQWTYVTNDVASWFVDFSATGMVLFADTYDAQYYGYWSTYAALHFSYEK